jgi:hypothetical protein
LRAGGFRPARAADFAAGLVTTVRDLDCGDAAAGLAAGVVSDLVTAGVSVLVSASVLASVLAGSGSPFSTRLRLPSLSDLKSVSYQPLPASRNRGADMSRFKLCLPHSGHSRNGLSEIFCRASR